MQTLIIPDIHTYHTWIEDFLEKTPHDRVVFLGDYFDDFTDTVQSNVDTANWLVQSLDKPNRTHLIGNHDLGYLCAFYHNWCSGWEEEKYRSLIQLLNPNWNRLNFATTVDGMLLTHAGVHSCWLGRWTDDEKNLFIQADDIEHYLNNYKSDVIGCGAARGVICSYDGLRSWAPRKGVYGGCLWLDWRNLSEDKEESVPFQIVGHTPGSVPRETDHAICMDVKGLVMEVTDSQTWKYLWR